MRIYTKVVTDIETGRVVEEHSFEYTGELALCFNGNGGDSEITVRYAAYIEEKHEAFLDAVATYRIATTDESPYTDYTDIIVEAAFFGTGYLISSFPSLYDMYGKFMAGLDVDALYLQLYNSIMNSGVIADLVSAEAALLSDDLIEEGYPRIEKGMLTTNSVMTSSFIIARGVAEATRLKLVEKFSADMKYRLIPVVTERWREHLSWNRNVVMTYAEIMKLYFAAKMDIEDFNYGMAAKELLWPFEVLDYERAALGALTGATKTTGVGGPSKTQKAVSGALGGASAGYMMTGGNPMGAVVGGFAGLALSMM